MKSAAQIAHIIACHKAGWSQRRIAAELAISRNTVTRLLRQSQAKAIGAEGRESKQQRCLDWLQEHEQEIQTLPGKHLLLRLQSEQGLRISQRTLERARAVLRHNMHQREVQEQDILNGWMIGPYQLSDTGALSLGGVRVTMTPLAEKLLLIFVRSANRVLSRREIANQLWEERAKGEGDRPGVTLIVHRLRQELARGPLGPDAIRSVYGKGYIFEVAVQPIQRVAKFSLPMAQRASIAGATNPFHLEAHDYWPNRDPYKLHRQESLLQKSICHDPTFEQGYLELCYYQILQCFWGMRSSIDVLPAVQKQLMTVERLPNQPEGWLAIKAEIQSLLLWQPRTTQRLYGTWLADTLPGGMPRYSWARHLIFSGQPKAALQLLTRQVHNDLCQGWLILAMACCALGDFGAAEEAVHHQLRVDSGMVGTRLFLAMLKACQGKTEQATRLIGDSGLLDRPFQGVQALTAYALAGGDMNQRSHQLLDQALALTKRDVSEVGAIGYWGLAALALGRQDQALQLLKLSVKHRCYSAPVLFRTPFLKPHANTLAVRLFTEAMRRGFAERP